MLRASPYHVHAKGGGTRRQRSPRSFDNMLSPFAMRKSKKRPKVCVPETPTLSQFDACVSSNGTPWQLFSPDIIVASQFEFSQNFVDLEFSPSQPASQRTPRAWRSSPIRNSTPKITYHSRHQQLSASQPNARRGKEEFAYTPRSQTASFQGFSADRSFSKRTPRARQSSPRQGNTPQASSRHSRQQHSASQPDARRGKEEFAYTPRSQTPSFLTTPLRLRTPILTEPYTPASDIDRRTSRVRSNQTTPRRRREEHKHDDSEDEDFDALLGANNFIKPAPRPSFAARRRVRTSSVPLKSPRRRTGLFSFSQPQPAMSSLAEDSSGSDPSVSEGSDSDEDDQLVIRDNGSVSDLLDRDFGIARYYFHIYARQNLKTIDAKGTGYEWSPSKRIWVLCDAVFIMGRMSKILQKHILYLIDDISEQVAELDSQREKEELLAVGKKLEGVRAFILKASNLKG